MKKYYICFDGDKVGENVQKFLIRNDIEQAVKFSNIVKAAIEEIIVIMQEIGAKCIFSGGDSMIFSCEEILKNEEIPIELNGITFSVGIGSNLELASLALFKAKSMGRCQIARMEK
nr:mCpol domain-containing protein [uncultured Cohaesibacter sp.]